MGNMGGLADVGLQGISPLGGPVQVRPMQSVRFWEVPAVVQILHSPTSKMQVC